MTLQILSPEGIVLKVDTPSVTLPGSEGSFTVLNHHASLLSTLAAGRIDYGPAGSGYAVESGIVEVRNNVVTVYL